MMIQAPHASSNNNISTSDRPKTTLPHCIDCRGASKVRSADASAGTRVPGYCVVAVLNGAEAAAEITAKVDRCLSDEAPFTIRLLHAGLDMKKVQLVQQVQHALGEPEALEASTLDSCIAGGNLRAAPLQG